MTKDPVCGMAVDDRTASRTSEYEKRTYYFCSAACKDRFDYEPAAFMHPAPLRE